MTSFRLNLLAMVIGAALALTGSAPAQQETGPIQGNAGQGSQPAGVSSGHGNAGASVNGGSPGASESTPTAPQGAGTQPAPPVDKNTPATDTSVPATDNNSPTTDKSSPSTDRSAPQDGRPHTVLMNGAGNENPNNPLLEVPPPPPGKPTLIGGKATRVDHVRNRLTIEPFGGGKKVSLFMDERTHVYRNGAETTVLGIRKGDRVYADTMLDGARVFAKNVRVENQAGAAEVRGQVTAVNREKGTITVKDELSSQPVSFAIDGRTRYNAYKGTAANNDLQPGSLVDVQLGPAGDKGRVAQEIVLLARTGDTYVFSGVVTNVDLRNSTLAVENRSDDQTYELHFGASALDDRSKLKVGSEVTAHAVFDGKQYKANDLQVQQATASDQGKPE
jgi:hypothetical protein